MRLSFNGAKTSRIDQIMILIILQLNRINFNVRGITDNHFLRHAVKVVDITLLILKCSSVFSRHLPEKGIRTA